MAESIASLELRKATMADLDAITRVVQLGFPDDPEFNYRFPYRQEYPEDNWKWVRREYASYVDQPKKYAVLVVTALVAGADAPPRREAIAVGVWDVATETESNSGGMSSSSLPSHACNSQRPQDRTG